MPKNTNKFLEAFLVDFTNLRSKKIGIRGNKRGNIEKKRKRTRKEKRKKQAKSTFACLGLYLKLKRMDVCCSQLAVFHDHNAVGALGDLRVVRDHQERLPKLLACF